MKVLPQVAYTRFDVCDLVAKHTDRKLRPEDSFYTWLSFCLIEGEKPFYSLREVKKFLYVSAYLYLKRDLGHAKAALALDLKESGYLYLETVSIEEFLERNLIFAMAQAHRERVAARRKQTKTADRNREPMLRYAVPTAV